MWEANADCDSLDSIQEISDALTPHIGTFGGCATVIQQLILSY